MLSEETKNKVNMLIYERAYEIATQLSEDDYFLAKLCGLKPEQVEDAALRVAVKELQKEWKSPGPEST